MTGVLKKEKTRHTEEQHRRMETEIGVTGCEPRNAKDCQQTIEAKKNAWNRFFPRSFRENMVLPVS